MRFQCTAQIPTNLARSTLLDPEREFNDGADRVLRWVMIYQADELVVARAKDNGGTVFVANRIETLEKIGDHGREQILAAAGEE